MKFIRIISFSFLLVFLCNQNSYSQLSEQERTDISKNMDILNAFFNELFVYYVDSLNSEKTIEQAISFVLQTLDPFSEYISEKDLPDFQFQATGEYGGIGSVISMRDKEIIIRDPYEGMPAANAGLIPGDRILEINGESMEDKTSQYASDLLKGQPNTSLKLIIKRIGEEKTRKITIERKRIHINPVTYYGVLDNNIGYICLSTFTTESAQTVKEAILDLVNQRKVTSLILDLRDNGGGVVEECLDMLNFFLPKGVELLSMKGKVKQFDKIYRATQMPIVPDLPIAILVNGNSASASEIVAGTIQDLDRGVILGNRTFGKGLVQATRPLPYGGQVKLTIAKYYIPSGRSIQAIDYTNRDENGRANVIPDSLTSVYYTANKRSVRDGGGILPDIIIENEKVPTMIYYLEMKSMFFDFVTEWRVKHPSIASPTEFVMTDEIYSEFAEFVKNHNFTYDLQSERTLEALKKSMELEGYMDVASKEFGELELLLKPNLERDLKIHKEIISNYLAMHIMRQYYYHKGQLIYELRDDKEVDKAIEILKDKDLYNSILKPQEFIQE